MTVYQIEKRIEQQIERLRKMILDEKEMMLEIVINSKIDELESLLAWIISQDEER